MKFLAGALLVSLLWMCSAPEHPDSESRLIWRIEQQDLAITLLRERLDELEDELFDMSRYTSDHRYRGGGI